MLPACADAHSHSDADHERHLGAATVLIDPPLHLDGRLDRARDGRERRHNAVAGVLHHPAVEAVDDGADDLVVGADDGHRLGVAVTLRDAGRVLDVGEEDRPERGLDPRFADGRLRDLAEEMAHHRRVDLDDPVGDEAVCLPVHRLHRVAIGPFGETEDRLVLRVVPVGDVTDAVLVLDGDVLDVRLRDVLRRRVRQVVPVHVERHGGATP
jgi:hypothetical protein